MHPITNSVTFHLYLKFRMCVVLLIGILDIKINRSVKRESKRNKTYWNPQYSGRAHLEGYFLVLSGDMPFMVPCLAV